MSKRKTVGLTVAMMMLQAANAFAVPSGFQWDTAFAQLEQALSGSLATAVSVGGLLVCGTAFAMSHDAGFGIKALIFVVAAACLMTFALPFLQRLGIIGLLV
jgi:type IV secretory pathway VirB2 component (pilin)